MALASQAAVIEDGPSTDGPWTGKRSRDRGAPVTSPAASVTASSRSTRGGRTPLLLAAYHGRAYVVKILLRDQRVEVSAEDEVRGGRGGGLGV
jgi:hypothetical protein